MSLRRNILASYISQAYVTALGILILPLYIKYMGSEAYGLIGFFTMLQAWFALLDLGLTPTIGRETARYHGGSMTALAYRQIFRSLSLIFLSIALVGGILLWVASDIIATQWLNVTALSIKDISLAVEIMAVSVALRWINGLYRGVITGSERLIWLSAFNVLIATLRFGAVFLSMWMFGYTPVVFFLHQLIVAIIEMMGLWIMTERLLPPKSVLTSPIGWSFKPIKPVLKFALTIAFTSSVWVLVTQTDKLILSGILPLAEYGHFTLAVLAASGIMIITGPISTAIMPRMARLHAEGRQNELITIYRSSTQLVSVVAGSIAVVIAFSAEPLMYVWTGDKALAKNVAPILQLYVAGNGILAIAAFPYYLQYALGNLRYHVIGNALMVIFLIPIIILAAKYKGGVGAGYAWLGINIMYMVIWVRYVHNKLVPGLNTTWLYNDVIVIIFCAIFSCATLSYFTNYFHGRIMILLWVGVLGLVTMVCALISAKKLRRKLSVWFNLSKLNIVYAKN